MSQNNINSYEDLRRLAMPASYDSPIEWQYWRYTYPPSEALHEERKAKPFQYPDKYQPQSDELLRGDYEAHEAKRKQGLRWNENKAVWEPCPYFNHARKEVKD